jgi:hypothetical protein
MAASRGPPVRVGALHYWRRTDRRPGGSAEPLNPNDCVNCAPPAASELMYGADFDPTIEAYA